MLTDDQREVRDLARDFAEGEIRPHAERWDRDEALDDALFVQLAELGFLGMLIPEEFGGLDFDIQTYLVVLEELARGDASAALSVAIHNGPVAGIVRAHASDAQREEWLPRLASGEALGAFALSEPDAGSDAASLACRAEPADGGGWRLTGTKAWVTNGERAGAVLVFARTGEGRHDIGCFLVRPGADGYRVARRATTMGMRASETVDVELDGVPGEVIGEPDRGFEYAMGALDLGRAGIAAQALGIAEAAMGFATGYALEREQFGRSIADFGAVQEKLASMAARIASARALTHEVGALLQRERESGTGPTRGVGGATARAAMAKVTASECAMWVADEAVQIYGGYGYMRDYPAERLMRDAKGTEIFEGTSEVLRHIIAREILREARDVID